MKRVNWYLISILIALSILFANNIAVSEIIVEDATYQIKFDVIPFPAFPDILPRTVLEYASTTSVWDLIFPEDIIVEAQKVVPRTIVEYASIKYQTSLYYPYDLFQVAKSVEPRIVIEYASTIGRFRRLIAIGCLRVVSIFAMELGRTNCSSSAPCRMDFDNDGDVDGHDAMELGVVVNNGACSDVGFGI